MELLNISQEKWGRKKFFYSIGTLIGGYLIFKTFPFKLFNNKNDKYFKNTQQVKIKINPLAVRRNKIGDNNGRKQRRS